MKIKSLILLITLMVCCRFTSQAQCTWHTASFDGFETNLTDTIKGIVLGTIYGSYVPAQWAVYNGSYSCYMNFIDSGQPSGVHAGDSVFSRIVQVCPNMPIQISAYFTTSFAGLQCNIGMFIIDGNNNVLNSQPSIVCPFYIAGVNSTWIQWQTGSFTPTTNTIRIKMITNVGGGGGNDLSWDNLLIQNCYTPPFTPATYTQTVCPKNPPINLYGVLSNLPPDTGTWSGPTTLTGGYLGTYSPPGNTTGIYIYSLSLGNSPVCPVIQDTVNTTIAAHLAIAAVPKTQGICPGDSVHITAAGKGTLSFSWLPSTYLTPDTGSRVLAKPLANITYTVTGTDSIGCTGTDTAIVTIYPLPIISVTPKDTSLCYGDSTTMKASGAYTYSWLPINTLSVDTGSVVIAHPLSNSQYTITGTSIHGCVSTMTDSVHLVPLPVVHVTPTTSAICIGAADTLKASGADTYVWAPLTTSPSTGAIVSAIPTTTTTYTITGTNGGKCSNTAQAVVTVYPLPVIIAKPDTTICPGMEVLLTAIGAARYKWQPAIGLSNDTIPNPTATVTATTIYTVTASSIYGCVNSAPVTVNVFNVPVVKTTPAIATIHLGNSITIAADGGGTYNWTPASTLNSSTLSDPVATPTVTTTYVVKVASANGLCISYDSVVVIVNDSAIVAVPNAFTPNNDGKNDMLHVLALGIFNLQYFKVFDRWGEMVYQTSDIKQGWDGTYHGKPEPNDVYVYVLEGTDEHGTQIRKQGDVLLMR